MCVTQWRKAQHTKAYVSIYDASKVQKKSTGMIFSKSMEIKELIRRLDTLGRCL